MSALWIAVVYGVAGVVAVLIIARRQGSIRWGEGVIAWVLWPFALPTALGTERDPSLASHRASPRGQDIARLRRSLSETLAALPEGPLFFAARVEARGVLDGFGARLEEEDARLVAIEQALGEAPAAAREKLEALRAVTAREIEERKRLLEDLVGQMTVLRFVDLSRPDLATSERERLSALLAQVEALTDSSIHGQAAIAPCGSSLAE